MKLLFVMTLILVLGYMMLQAEACICTADYKPVCGTNGKTYSNKCSLNCAKVRMAHTGPCR